MIGTAHLLALSTIGILTGSIATLAGIIGSFMTSRLEAEDKLIGAQSGTISKLREETFSRKASGCGRDHCSWKTR